MKRMKNGQEYCSVLRVQFSMNQKQLSWLLFNTLPSARKWDFFFFFQIFFAGKVFCRMESNEVFFSLSNVKVLEVWGRLAGNKKAEFWRQQGGSAIYLSQPQSPSGPLAILNHDCL